MSAENAGFIRFNGSGRDGFPLVSDDMTFEVCQADGTWIPLQGVCHVKFDIAAAQIVTADVVLEIGGLDIGNVPVSRYIVPSRWQRFVRWFHRWIG